MESIKTSISRIHPLVAAAAVSVIVVSLAGTAAITGLLPSSHGANQAASLNNQQAAAQLAPVASTSAPYGAGYAPSEQQGVQLAPPAQAPYGQAVASTQPAAPAPVVIEKTIIKEVPAKTVSHPVHHHTTDTQSYARDDGNYAPAANPAPAQPNYVAIGTGAVVGGLLGNQVGHGNGRKLATVAGMIGGGLLGNQIANQNR